MNALEKLRDHVADVQCELSVAEARAIRAAINEAIDALTAAMPQVDGADFGIRCGLLVPLAIAAFNAEKALGEATLSHCVENHVAMRGVIMAILKETAKPASSQVDGEAIKEALDHIEALCDFAYQQGFHELGYDPVREVRNYLATARPIAGEAISDAAAEAMLAFRYRMKVLPGAETAGGNALRAAAVREAKQELAAALPHLSAPLPPQGAAVDFDSWWLSASIDHGDWKAIAKRGWDARALYATPQPAAPAQVAARD